MYFSVLFQHVLPGTVSICTSLQCFNMYLSVLFQHILLCTQHFLLCPVCLCFSTVPKPKKSEYIVPLIKNNVWRLPTAKDSSEGAKADDEHRKLQEQAASAILKGTLVV